MGRSKRNTKVSAAAPPAIRLRGVHQNNLKGFDLDLPKNRLVVITGPSGAGKSSLAFETLYAEGQRRYIETFSPYARQFLDRMDKPRVDAIEGIPPAIAIEQRNTVRTTRSTVGTMTEICDYLKALWPHISRLHCRQCGQPVQRDSPDQIARRMLADTTLPPELLVVFTLPLSPRLPLDESLELLARQGYRRLLHDHTVLRLEDAAPRLASAPPDHLRVVQDRLRRTPSARSRLAEACTHAYHFGKGRLEIHALDPATQSAAFVARFSQRLHCAACDIAYPDPTPALFSFNHPQGACPACRGFGRVIGIDDRLVLPDTRRTLAQGVVRPWQTGQGMACQTDLLKFCRQRGVPVNVPFRALPPDLQHWVIEGDPGYGQDKDHEWPRAWYGVRGYFRWLEGRAYKMHVRVQLSRYRAYRECPTCHGKRFQPDTLLYRAPNPPATPAASTSPHSTRNGDDSQTSLDLAAFYQLKIDDALDWVRRLARSRAELSRGPLAFALEQLRNRLAFLQEAGLGYLTLNRPTRTLSGGETERVNLTTCLGTELVNTLYVLDEPTVGLHARDVSRLVAILQRLRDLGNTVVVVEHDPAVMRAADHLIDLGPASGAGGGHLVYTGPGAAIAHCRTSLTGAYLSGRRRVGEPDPTSPPTPTPLPAPEQPAAHWLVVENATRHNLRNLTVRFPLERLVCITGVSGSGKTTLVKEILWPLLVEQFGNTFFGPTPAPASDDPEPQSTTASDDQSEAEPAALPGPARLLGLEYIHGAVFVDQSPVGRTPRSNPAVYSGAFEYIRKLFAATDVARTRGLKSTAFSFNGRRGQCERCRGAGFEKIEMQFLSDVFIRCPACKGSRYRDELLDIRLPPVHSLTAPALKFGRRQQLGPNIAEILEYTIDQAIAFLAAWPEPDATRPALDCLRPLSEVGLGYLHLGQPVNTLSGGESQRLKLAAHLGSLNDSNTEPLLFLFDEPTTGLHLEDVRVLLRAFRRLVHLGHSVFVIEHNLDLIRCADWIVDLGPEAAEHGGQVVAAGPPAHIAVTPASHTGRVLRQHTS